MKVEQWLRGHFHGLGSQIELNVLEVAAISPMEALPSPMNPVNLDDDIEERFSDEEFMKSLNYALSTLYYSMSAAITGGTKSEKRGNRQVSVGGYPLTTKDRESFRKMGDRLRAALGCKVDNTSNTYQGGMFDASSLSAKPKFP